MQGILELLSEDPIVTCLHKMVEPHLSISSALWKAATGGKCLKYRVMSLL